VVFLPKISFLHFAYFYRGNKNFSVLIRHFMRFARYSCTTTCSVLGERFCFVFCYPKYTGSENTFIDTFSSLFIFFHCAFWKLHRALVLNVFVIKCFYLLFCYSFCRSTLLHYCNHFALQHFRLHLFTNNIVLKHLKYTPTLQQHLIKFWLNSLNRLKIPFGPYHKYKNKAWNTFIISPWVLWLCHMIEKQGSGDPLLYAICQWPKGICRRRS